MNCEEIAAAADASTPTGTSSVSLHLRKGDKGEPALLALFDVLGDDATIAHVEISLDGAYAGSLPSESFFGLVVDGTMGMSDVDRANLQGDRRPCYVALHCVVEGCPRRIITVPDLNDPPIVCPTHHSEMQPDEAA